MDQKTLPLSLTEVKRALSGAANDAIGYVVMGTFHEAAQEKNNEADPTSALYHELMQLTAERWLNQEL